MEEIGEKWRGRGKKEREEKGSENGRGDEKRTTLHIASISACLLAPDFIDIYYNIEAGSCIPHCWSFTLDNGISLQADSVAWNALLV